MKKEELIKKNADLLADLRFSEAQDLRVRKQFARVFGWTQSSMYSTSIKTSEPAWEEIFNEVGKLQQKAKSDYFLSEVLDRLLPPRKLESKVWTADFIEKYRPALENLAKADDTHRTVTLRIPKGMRVGEAMYEVWTEIIGDSYGILEISDTDLQKALDEVKGESNE